MGVESELVEVFETARKAAERASRAGDAADEARCVETIKAMHALPITTSVLISTQVGKSLRGLTKHHQPKIKKAATELLEAWKKAVVIEVINEATQAASTSEEVTSRLRPIEKVDKRVLQLQGKAESKKPEMVKPAAAAPVKLSSLPKTNEVARDKIREMLAEALTKVTSEADGHDLQRASASDPILVAVSVETVMFERLGLAKGVNKMKYRSIMFNVKDNNNPDLRRRLLLGDLKPEQLVNMTPEEMASDQRKAENRLIQEKALFECERGLNQVASTDQFKCGKCGKRKCTYFQMQTRSADEPMTTFVTCVNCNHHWRFC